MGAAVGPESTPSDLGDLGLGASLGFGVPGCAGGRSHTCASQAAPGQDYMT